MPRAGRASLAVLASAAAAAVLAAVLALYARLPTPLTHAHVDSWIPPLLRPTHRTYHPLPYAPIGQSSAGIPRLTDEGNGSLPLVAYPPKALDLVRPYNLYGLGIDDITGPIVQTNMMGYATLEQWNQGIHMRTWARAFIVGSAASSPKPYQGYDAHDPLSDPGGLDPVDGAPDRWVLVNADICMGDTAVRRALVHRLRAAYPGLYGEINVAFVGTHNHAGSAGYHNTLLPTVTNLGISRQNFDAIVEGSYRAVLRAHADFEARRAKVVALASSSGRKARKELDKLQMAFANATLKEAHINRSPIAYEANPEEEKAYWGSQQDDEFSLLRFKDFDGKPSGFLSWYAIHGTSLKVNNTLASSDNKGLAAVMVEQYMAEQAALARGAHPAEAAAQALDVAPGTTPFIAGFSQASVGDTSPNTLGSFCEGSNLPCDYRTSTCPVPFMFGTRNTTTTCHSRGPGHGDEVALSMSPTGGYDWRSNEIIAEMQAKTAEEILSRSEKAWTPLSGPTRAVKWVVDMSNYTFALPNGTRVSTRPASLGFAFAGGTTDGPGQFDFHQGHTTADWTNPLWRLLRPLVNEPTAEQKAGHGHKHILFDTGMLKKPYAWSPSAVETQIFRVGQMFILVVPGEFTTMAGRRLKAAVRASVAAHLGVTNPIVVLCGPGNTYSHYITTPEEYAVQRYEGGATVFGPWTLAAFTDIYSRVLVPALKPDAPPMDKGWMVPINIGRAHHFMPSVYFDRPGLGHAFGDVLVQPKQEYVVPASPTPGLAPIGTHDPTANVSISFIAANPRNDLRLGESHFAVQRWERSTPEQPFAFGSERGTLHGDNGWWHTVRTDAHHTTTLRWTPTSYLFGTSRVDISWAIEPHTLPGVYRVLYTGAAKALSGEVTPFRATSRSFSLRT